MNLITKGKNIAVSQILKQKKVILFIIEAVTVIDK